MNQLPAYLQNRAGQSVAQRATAGMGSVLPPHISIAGNTFTLVDAAGVKHTVGHQIRGCIVDIADVMTKRYYENEWTPGSDEPPTCFSMNGLAPSREAQSPQSPTCASCQWNERGSAVSKISNKAIKACRDEKPVAFIPEAYPHMIFQLVIPPGSFKNWSAFTQPFLKGDTDISDVLVLMGFQPQVNGVLTFQAVEYISEQLYNNREAATREKKTDVLVGRLDQPIAAALAGPQGGTPAQVQHQPQGQVVGNGPASGAAAPTATPSFGLQEQPSATLTQQGIPTGNGQGFAATASPSNQPEAQRRRRRTKAEIAADEAAKAAAQHPGQQAPAPQAQTAQSAGFGAPPAQPPQGNFGAPAPQNGFGAPGPAPQQGGFGQPAPQQAQQPTFGAPAPQGQPQGFAPPTGGAAARTGGFQGPQQSAPPAGGGFGIQQGADPAGDPQLMAMLAQVTGQPSGPAG